MRTKLQLALDMLSLEEAVSIADATRAYVDIIEVGTVNNLAENQTGAE